MDERPWHSRPIFYILLFQFAILSYVSLAWGPRWTAALFPKFGFFHLAGVLGLFLASFFTLVAFLKGLFSMRHAQMNLIQLGALLALGAWFLLLGVQRVAGSGSAPGVLQDFFPLFTLFWALYALVLPLLARLWWGLGTMIRMLLPLPRLETGLAFALNFMLAVTAGTLFQRFFSLPSMTFEQAIWQVHEGIAGLLCALIGLDLLSQVNAAIGQAREREFIGSRRRRVVVQPLRPQPEVVEELETTRPSRPVTGAVRKVRPAETQPTRVDGD